MAKKIVTYLIDDIDGSDAVDTIVFAVDGVTYEIDLNKENAAALRADFDKWIKPARRISGRRTRRSAAPAAASDAGRIREWARENGYEVSERGRIPAEIRAAYEQRAK